MDPSSLSTMDENSHGDHACVPMLTGTHVNVCRNQSTIPRGFPHPQYFFETKHRPPPCTPRLSAHGVG